MHKLPGIAVGILALLLATGTMAQTADELRGGWAAEIDGVTHIYIVKIEGDAITGGVYCHQCDTAENVAFIRGGSLKNGELDFTVLHDLGEGAPYTRNVHGKLVNGKLMVSSNGGNAVAYSRQPRPAPRPPLDRPEYAPYGPAEQLTKNKVVGYWTANPGRGDRKQFMMIREVEGELMGLVCGACDEVHRMGVLENFSINGSQLYFEVVHEDVGTPDGLNNAPFYNTVDAVIVNNELHMDALRNLDPPGTKPFPMMFVGPLVR